MRLLNRLWEVKAKKTRDHHLKTFEILIKAVSVPPLQLGTALSRGSYVREELQDHSAFSVRPWGLKELPLAAYPKNRALPWKVKNEHNLPPEREFPWQHPHSLPDIAGKKGTVSQAGTFRLSVLPVTHFKSLKVSLSLSCPLKRSPLCFSFVAGLMLSQKDMNVWKKKITIG